MFKQVVIIKGYIEKWNIFNLFKFLSLWYAIVDFSFFLDFVDWFSRIITY